MPQRGDLQTLSVPIEVDRNEPFSLPINQVVP